MAIFNECTKLSGPIHTASAEVFDDFDDEHGQNLLGSLHLDAEEEPVRRGASRANSVRFDVSAIQGSNWAQPSRSSGEFGPTRPNSGFGNHPMERTLSHKSDGRHSSAGHSIHSLHSAPSGRTSSLGLNTNFGIGGRDDTSPFDIPEPPPGLFVLGNVPSIIRCWLSENFSHSALLYAVVCTGSQKSTLEHTLVKELRLTDRIEKDVTGISTIRLPVYLPEAVVTQPASRANSPAPQLPALTVNFEVTGINQHLISDRRKDIRIFLGSDILRAHSADLLLSQNVMTLYGDDRNRLSVPFVRPEDESVFKNLYTTNVIRDKVGLKGTAAPFTPADQMAKTSSSSDPPGNGAEPSTPAVERGRSNAIPSPLDIPPQKSVDCGESLSDLHKDSSPKTVSVSNKSLPEYLDSKSSSRDIREERAKFKNLDTKPTTNGETNHRESVGGIWGSWRSGGISGNDNEALKDNVSTSGYNRPGHGGRGMKVLKPSKVAQNSRSSSGPRAAHTYEPPPHSPLEDSQPRRKSQISLTDSNASLRWEPKRSVSEDKAHKDVRPIASLPRSSNPIGGASAFAWMKPGNVRTDVTTGK